MQHYKLYTLTNCMTYNSTLAR